jgi:dUTPase
MLELHLDQAEVIDPDYYTGGIHVVLRNASLASYEVQKHE